MIQDSRDLHSHSRDLHSYFKRCWWMSSQKRSQIFEEGVGQPEELGFGTELKLAVLKTSTKQ